MIDGLCESEIERQVGFALFFGLLFANADIFVPLNLDKTQDKKTKCILETLTKNANVLICPNLWIDRKTRPDFVILYKPPKKRKHRKLIIECDSFLYHSTPEQLLKEKQRERRLVKLGIPILRFSGKEIYKNPTKVATEIIDFMFHEVV